MKEIIYFQFLTKQFGLKKKASGDEIGLAEKRFMAGSLQIASK